MTASGPVVVWFRRDLRLHDHPALADALASGRPVAPLFVFDPRLLHGRFASANRAWFLLGSVGGFGGSSSRAAGGSSSGPATRGGGPRVRRRRRCRRCVRQPGLHTLRTATGPRGGGRLGGARRATPRQARPARPRARRRARTIRLVVRCLQPVPPTLGGTLRDVLPAPAAITTVDVADGRYPSCDLGSTVHGRRGRAPRANRSCRAPPARGVDRGWRSGRLPPDARPARRPPCDIAPQCRPPVRSPPWPRSPRERLPRTTAARDRGASSRSWPGATSMRTRCGPSRASCARRWIPGTASRGRTISPIRGVAARQDRLPDRRRGDAPAQRRGLDTEPRLDDQRELPDQGPAHRLAGR